ncbi:MAG: Orotidine 5-phosphate decarboxylase [Parcubacteria group bacterium]|nr:Orotidine 5-phosphate decarboxylase [Parcubacteria group bacterium]
MSTRHFNQMLENKWAEGKFVCVGLDSELEKIPAHLHHMPDSGGDRLYDTIFKFNKGIVDATHDLVCAYKPNIAFYERYASDGLFALQKTIGYIHAMAPDVPVILDAKRADIDNTNVGYVISSFDRLGADAITVHPYLGSEALQPFLSRPEKGVIVLCRTSNRGAGEFQDYHVVTGPSLFGDAPQTRPLYQVVAMHVAQDWNKNGNCAVVVGATYPHELEEVRELVRDMPILIPGIGAQGGDLQATVAAGKNSFGRGMIINSSRGIIFASKGKDFAEAARRETQTLHENITRFLEVSSGDTE